MFAIATKRKYRYPYKGQISTEDLWDLNTEELDKIYKTLNQNLKNLDCDSLLATKTDHQKREIDELRIKIDIIKYIVRTKLDEVKCREVMAANTAKKNHLHAILEMKENEELMKKSPDELRKMINEL